MGRLGFCICIDGAFMGRSTPTTAFNGTIFVCTDSTEIFLSKLRSSCSNYNLPSLFHSLLLCGGVSNKHCLLTFFIYPSTGNMMETCPVRSNQSQFLVHDIVDLSFFRLYDGQLSCEG